MFYRWVSNDNGLPTRRLVEKVKKIRATDMSREAFIAECLSVSEEARARVRTLFRSIALSVDWDQRYHTISDDSAAACRQLSFLDLIKNDNAYRATPFYWDRSTRPRSPPLRGSRDKGTAELRERYHLHMQKVRSPL